jgi:hypothetical protein
MATNKFFFRLGSFWIKDGTQIHFWGDKWLDNTTLRKQYPALYNIIGHKGDTIAFVMEYPLPRMWRLGEQSLG